MTATRDHRMRALGLSSGRGLVLSLLVLAVSIGARDAGGQEPAVLSNWASPPYWVPANPAPSDAVAGGGLEASSEASLAAGAPALPFFTITPCRLADTRAGAGFSGPFGPPSMPGSVIRSFPIAGQCGIPANARAVSFNFTVTSTLGPGFLVVYPQGGTVPNVSTLNYLANQTIANAAVVPLGAGGGISAIPGVLGFELIIDVNGYYAPSGIVSSLNTLTGDVTLAAGPNITVTPSGNTLTVAASLANLNASNVTSGVLGLSFGGTGATSTFGARINLGAAGLGANSDITSLSGLITPLSVAQGGTGSATPFQSSFQARVTGTCPAGSFLVSVASNGTVGCGTPTADPRPGFARAAVDAAGSVGAYSSVAIGEDGLGLISYYDLSNGDLKVAHCNNTACTSAAASTLDSAGTVGAFTSIAIGADGLGLISYYDIGNGDLKAAHCNNTACTSATVATLDSAGDVGRYTSVAIGADGLGLISYYDNGNSRLKVAHCNATACSSAAVATLDTGTGYYSALTVGADGLGLISYFDLVNLDLKVAHCSNAACSAATLATIDSTGDVGEFSSLTIGADGLGLIAYNANQAGLLKAAHCDNAACSTATLSVLDSAGFVGQHTAVTMGDDGLGLISYYEFISGDGNLKVAHCANVTCGSASTATLDSAGDVGQFTSITIGADGLGLISYWDATNGDLKVVHCGNALCTPFVRRR